MCGVRTMSVDIDMNIYVSIEDFDECLEDVVAAFEGENDVDLVTPSGQRIRCPISDNEIQLNYEDGLPDEIDIKVGTAVELCGGEFHLNAGFGSRYACIHLGWCSPYSVPGEIYEDLVDLVDPAGDCVRTIGLPGEMSPLIRRGTRVFSPDRLNVDIPCPENPECVTPDEIDREAMAWFAAVKKS